MNPLVLIGWIWYTQNQGESLIRFIPLLVNWLMGQFSTMIISFCKPILNEMMIKLEPLCHILRIFPEKNRFENARLAWKTLYPDQTTVISLSHCLIGSLPNNCYFPLSCSIWGLSLPSHCYFLLALIGVYFCQSVNPLLSEQLAPRLKKLPDGNQFGDKSGA